MQKPYSAGPMLSNESQHKPETFSPHKRVPVPQHPFPSTSQPDFSNLQESQPHRQLSNQYTSERHHHMPSAQAMYQTSSSTYQPQVSHSQPKPPLKVNTIPNEINIARSRPMPSPKIEAPNISRSGSDPRSVSNGGHTASQRPPPLPIKMPVPEIPSSVRDQLAMEQQRSREAAQMPLASSQYSAAAYDPRQQFTTSHGLHTPTTPIYSPSTRLPVYGNGGGDPASNAVASSGTSSDSSQSSASQTNLPNFPIASQQGFTVGQSLSQSLNSKPFIAKHRRFGSDTGVPTSSLTVDQFETVRRYADTQPHDPRAQLELAKRLCEASEHLANRYTDPYHPSSMEVDERQQSRNQEAWTSQALKITKKLATKVHYPDALFFLGSIYSSGKCGVDMDHVKALDCYQKAAKLEHPDACYRIAVCEEFGVGTRPNIEKAVSWYKKAAMLGSVGSMYKLGMLSLLGSMGQPRDFNAGLSWLQRAAERADEKNPHAVHELALLYERSPLSTYVAGDLIPHSEAKALELYYTAAKLGYAPSQARLGRAFEYGELGCSVEPSWSISWYSQAAHQGDSDAELGMAGWYWTGSPQLKRSYAEAFLWAERSASQGNPRAMYAIGFFCEVGIGVHRDINRAKKWYMLAAEKKHPRAAQKLRTID